MIKSISSEQIIAIGGIFQACQLVDNISRNGSVPGDQFDTCIRALLSQNPESTEAVYGSIQNLTVGFESMQTLLTLKDKTQNSNVLRYVLGALYLSKKLQNNQKLMAKVGKGIDQANQQAEVFHMSHNNVVANLAQLYRDSIGTLRYRIQVNGYPDYLQQENIAARIRCLLFSAIRSAILWQQLNGRRYHLVFCRKTILRQLYQLQRNL